MGSWSGSIHPDDKERTLKSLTDHLNDYSGNTPFDVECRIKTKSGEYRCFHAFGTTRRSSVGLPLRVAGAMMDITEKKRMTAKIEADAHWYKSILDAVPLHVAVTDAHMNWTFVNKAVEELLGEKREDLIGKKCRNWNYNICDTEDCAITRAKRGLKRTFFNQNDSSYQVDVEILLDLEGAINGFIEVVQDITNIQELAKQWAEMEMTSQAKSAFLANMSHEIRTPMHSIWGITEILLQNEDLSEETKEALERIYNSCNLLLGIINDILDFSKIEAGKLDIVPGRYTVASLINDSVYLNIMRIDEKPIEFEVQVDENTPAELMGDELRIKQILNNLLSNAIKYTESGKITQSVAY
jgi:PAS domain S-box-containing protein